jgi:type IV pilus assembly protein PilF
MMQTIRSLSFLLALIAILGGCTSVAPSRSGNAPELDRGVQQTPDEIAKAKAKASLELAAGYFQRGQHAIALEELENAVRAQPDYAAAWGLYGLVFHSLKEDGKAEANFQKAMNIAPNDPELRTNYGWFLCRTNREAESVAEFERAANNTLYRTPELALLYGAQCASRVGKMQIAEQFYKRILGVTPDAVAAFFGLTEVTYKVGRYAETRNYLKAATRSTQVPAHILAIGVCVETRLGDSSAVSSYLTQLRNRFPNAVETARAINGDCD